MRHWRILVPFFRPLQFGGAAAWRISLQLARTHDLWAILFVKVSFTNNLFKLLVMAIFFGQSLIFAPLTFWNWYIRDTWVKLLVKVNFKYTFINWSKPDWHFKYKYKNRGLYKYIFKQVLSISVVGGFDGKKCHTNTFTVKI